MIDKIIRAVTVICAAVCTLLVLWDHGKPWNRIEVFLAGMIVGFLFVAAVIQIVERYRGK